MPTAGYGRVRGRRRWAWPVAIKNDVDLGGEPTAFGCASDFPPAVADCELVRLLRASGAIVVGSRTGWSWCPGTWSSPHHGDPARLEQEAKWVSRHPPG